MTSYYDYAIKNTALTFFGARNIPMALSQGGARTVYIYYYNASLSLFYCYNIVMIKGQMVTRLINNGQRCP